MLIGIDGSHLYENSGEGTVIYLENIIRGLSHVNVTDHFKIYHKHVLSAEYKGRLTNANANFSFICLPKTISWTQVSLARSLFEDTPDIIICPWQTMPIIHPQRTKILSIIHGLEYSRLNFAPTFYSCIFSDHIVAVSNFTKDAILKNFKVSENKVSVIHEGVNFNLFKKASEDKVVFVKKKFAITNDYIFFVGTVGPRKNVPNMIKAFASVIKAGRIPASTQFVLAGKILESQEDVLDLPATLGISDNVKFIGKISEDDLVCLYSGARLFSFVSISEGFGLPVLEAMSCQTPVLTSNVSALLESGGDAAYYVDPLDCSSIEDGICNLFHDSELRNTLMSLGSQHVKKFSWENSAKGIMEAVSSYVL